MPNGEKPKFEGVIDLAKRRAERAKQGPARTESGPRENVTLLEGIDPKIIELARMKAEQILARASYNEHLSALAHIDQIIADKTPAEMIDALDNVVLSAKDQPQMASEIELALAFLLITEKDSTESK